MPNIPREDFEPITGEAAIYSKDAGIITDGIRKTIDGIEHFNVGDKNISTGLYNGYPKKGVVEHCFPTEEGGWAIRYFTQDESGGTVSHLALISKQDVESMSPGRSVTVYYSKARKRAYIPCQAAS